MFLKAQSEVLYELIDAEAGLEKLADGFMFTEGPVWMPNGSLLFSDMPADKRRRWHPEEGVSVVKAPTNKGNGMAIDPAGNVYVCEHTTSRVVRENADGSSTIVASHYDGKELNSPNDCIVTNDGSVLFTDPTFGRTVEAVGLLREVQLDFRGVFRIPPGGGALQLLADDFSEPNGLCLSPDGLRLYVNDTMRAHIRVFDVGPDYALSNSRVFAENIGEGGGDPAGIVDGMKTDEQGNVYVTGPGGLWVFDSTGKKLGEVVIPNESVGNIAWGDDDWSSLYICASSTLYRLRTKVPGDRAGYPASRCSTDAR